MRALVIEGMLRMVRLLKGTPQGGGSRRGVADDGPDGLWMAAENWYALTRRECAPRGGIDGPRVVIVNLHWGDQYIAQPSSFQLALAGTLNCSPDITAIVGRAYRPADRRSQRKLVVFGEGKPDLRPDQRLLPGASQDAMMALLMIMDGRRRVRGATYRASWAAAGTHVSSPRCPAGRLLAARRATRLDGRDVCAYSSPCAVPSPSASASASILARRV